MDFRQTSQPSTSRPVAPTPATPAAEQKTVKRDKNVRKSWTWVLSAVLLVGIVVLLIGIALAFTRGASDNEFKYVTASKYQAVFLNNGQVYFGNIDSLNDKYVRMSNIFYLTQSGDSKDSNYSLVKLGCQQIHDPTDQMLINRDQVTFWENLQDNGKVVSSIKQFIKQNPNGPDCSQVSNQTQASGSSSTAQGSSSTGSSSNTTNSSTSTTGSGSTTTK